MLPLSINLQDHGFRIHKYTGEHVTTQHSLPLERGAPTINGHRGELHLVLLRFVKELGVDVRLGCDVVGCFEGTDGKGKAGIEILGGERVRLTIIFTMLFAKLSRYTGMW